MRSSFENVDIEPFIDRHFSPGNNDLAKPNANENATGDQNNANTGAGADSTHTNAAMLALREEFADGSPDTNCFEGEDKSYLDSQLRDTVSAHSIGDNGEHHAAFKNMSSDEEDITDKHNAAVDASDIKLDDTYS